MKKLPHWSIPDVFPAFHDTESLSTIEMTGRLYGAMQTLIDEYNTFADRLEKSINDYYLDTTKSFDVFAVGLRQEFQDFINVINMKTMGLGNEIEELKETFFNKIQETLNEYLVECHLTVNLTYNEEEEELLFVINETDASSTGSGGGNLIISAELDYTEGEPTIISCSHNADDVINAVDNDVLPVVIVSMGTSQKAVATLSMVVNTSEDPDNLSSAMLNCVFTFTALTNGNVTLGTIYLHKIGENMYVNTVEIGELNL